MVKDVCKELNYYTTRILEVRYTDLEEEERLCRELLKLSDSNGDAYGQMFAHTFLGDYYVAVNEVDRAGDHLLRALALLEDKQMDECDEVRMRVYLLLGIFYEHRADEQNSIQYNIDALSLARKLGDAVSEGAILNNMAFSFQRRNDSDMALAYFKHSYELQKSLPDSHLRIIFMSNLAEALSAAGKPDEALQYIEECERAEADPVLKERCLQVNWCLYHAKKGEMEQCVKWVDKILSQQNDRMQEKMLEFENYHALFQCMMDIGCGEYAHKFFKLMEKTCQKGSVDQLNIMEKKRIAYVLAFEPEEKHFEAYRRYYEKMQEIKNKIDETITSAMKAMIRLDELNRSNEALVSEQEELKSQNDIDELTGSYSRRHMENLVRRLSEGEQRKEISIVMVDVDYFKEYNDHYKHIKGDEVLKAVSGCLNDNRTEGIYPCRFGGDEFTCICEDVGESQIREYIALVRADLERRNIEHKKSLCADRVTLSVGAAIGSGSTDTTVVMELADRALYRSKKEGRNRVTVVQVESL